ncbi:MAG: glycosyltransferase family 9 protein [Verrucomicrobiae bacterium]
MRSVLLIKPGSMGDVVHALPVASAIRRAWPEAVLTWVVDPRWAPLLEGNPAVSAAKFFPREEFRGVAGWARAARWYRALGSLQPDVVVDLQGLLRSAWMAKCSGGRLVCGLGDAREGAGFFYNRTTEVLPGEHAVRRYLRVLPLLGIDVPEECEFPLPPGIPSEISGGYVVLHPFARGAGKSLGAEAIRAFVTEFRARSSAPVVIVGMGDVPGGMPVVNLAGKTTLLALLGVLRSARFVVSVDSGPMHLAAAVGAPMLGIHTWSDPRLVGPYRADAWIWQGGDIRRQGPGFPPLPEMPFTPDAAAGVARFVATQSG